MTTQTKALELSDFVVITDLPDNAIQSPTFLTGDFGQAVYREYEREKALRFEDNPYLRLQSQGDVITGSNLFDIILVNQIIRGLRGSPRTALPSDLSNPRVLEMIREKHYADSQGLVLRSVNDSVYPKNNPLAEYLAEHVDMPRVEREPVLITGLSLDPWPEDERGYKLRTTVSPEGPTTHYDDRFLGKWNDYRFDEADELGLPLGLSKDKGFRIWYTRDDGLSRLCLGRSFYLDSDRSNLDDSGSVGRVVVLGGEAASKNF